MKNLKFLAIVLILCSCSSKVDSSGHKEGCSGFDGLKGSNETSNGEINQLCESGDWSIQDFGLPSTEILDSDQTALFGEIIAQTSHRSPKTQKAIADLIKSLILNERPEFGLFEITAVGNEEEIAAAQSAIAGIQALLDATYNISGNRYLAKIDDYIFQDKDSAYLIVAEAGVADKISAINSFVVSLQSIKATGNTDLRDTNLMQFAKILGQTRVVDENQVILPLSEVNITALQSAISALSKITTDEAYNLSGHLNNLITETAPTKAEVDLFLSKLALLNEDVISSPLISSFITLQSDDFRDAILNLWAQEPFEFSVAVENDIVSISATVNNCQEGSIYRINTIGNSESVITNNLTPCLNVEPGYNEGCVSNISYMGVLNTGENLLPSNIAICESGQAQLSFPSYEQAPVPMSGGYIIDPILVTKINQTINGDIVRSPSTWGVQLQSIIPLN